MTFREILSLSVSEAARSLGIQMSLYPLAETSQDYEIRLSRYPRPSGFGVLVREEYLSWGFEVVFDELSRPMLATMREAFAQNTTQLLEREKNLALDATNYKFLINGSSVTEDSSQEEWLDFRLSGTMDLEKSSNSKTSLATGLLEVLSIPLELLIENSWLNEEAQVGELEGAKNRTIVNKYERNRFNRAICLAQKGFTCQGCEMDMASTYGPIGEGVIHVHHIVPVSKMDGEARVNPLTELVPLCPNCHNIVHRVDPPLPIEELRLIVQGAT